MKSWLGVLGRALLEFLILLALVAVIAGADAALPGGAPAAIIPAAAAAALLYWPLAVACILFLSFFSFESRVRSRLAAWMGSLLIASLLVGGGMALRRIPSLLPASKPAPVSAGAEPEAGIALIGPGTAIFFARAAGGTVSDLVTVDFAAPPPRLSYIPTAAIEAGGRSVLVAGQRWALPGGESRRPELVPEAGALHGLWIWERLAATGPIARLAALAGAFVLLAAGCRFLARLTSWPLANAFFAMGGLVGLLVADASLASPEIAQLLAPLAGTSLPPWLPAAAAEGAIGILLALADIALPPRGRRSHG